MFRNIFKHILIFLVFILSFSNFAIGQKDDYSKAILYLEQIGEVNFSFQIGSTDKLEAISRIISIDKVEDLTVFAYANSKEFENFLLLGYSYTILQPPGELSVPTRTSVQKTDWTALDYDFSYYPTYEQYVNEIMVHFESSYPTFCKIIERGTSVNGRKILFAKISSNVNVTSNKPRFMFVSTMHGNETAGFIIMLRFINYLLDNYDIDPRITDLVDNIEFWINPLLNPDGTYTNDNSTDEGARRYNAANIDLNRNFPDFIYGEHPDGYQTQPENQAIISLHNEYEFVISANIHAGVECIAYPWFTTANSHNEEAWFENVGTKYANLAQQNSPAGYFTSFGDGVTKGSIIPASGTISDYLIYYQNCRDITIEFSNEKLLPENQLNSMWDYNYQSLVNYIEELYPLICIENRTITNEFSGGVHNVLASNTIVASNAVINGATVNYSAGNSIKLITGFKANSGVSFLADLNGCVTNSLKSIVGDDGISLAVTRANIKQDSKEKYTNLNNQLGNYLIYPNPNNGLFTIQVDDANSTYSVNIYNLNGSEISDYKNLVGDTELDLRHVSKGVYIVRLIADDDVLTKRIIIN